MNAPVDGDVELARDGVRPVPAAHEAHARFWLGQAPTTADITLALPDACIDELDVALRRLPALADGEQPGDTSLDAAARAALSRTATFAAEVRERLEHGPGAVIVDRFPAGRWSVADNRRAVAAFSELVAPLKAQGFDGTTLYDVVDKRVEDVSKVRRSITNLGQPYHTDGPWFAVPARYIGLYCIRNAERGGHSRVTSLLAALDALRAAGGGDVLAELARPHPWDRQGEHAPEDSPWESHPLVVENEAGFLARFYEGYVRRGYVLSGERMSDATERALGTLAAALEAQPAIRFLMEPGQFQYANNYTVVHARDAFEDAREAAGNGAAATRSAAVTDAEAVTDADGRRLVRVWHR